MPLTPLDYIRQSTSLHLDGAQLSSDEESVRIVEAFLGGDESNSNSTGSTATHRLFIYLPSFGALEALVSAEGFPSSAHCGSLVVVNTVAPKAVTVVSQLQVMVLTPPVAMTTSSKDGSENEVDEESKADAAQLQMKVAATDSLAMYTRHAYSAVIQSLFKSDDMVLEHVQTKIRDLELTLEQLKRRSKGGGNNLPIVNLKAHDSITLACANLSANDIQSSSLSIDDEIFQNLPLSDDSWLNDVQSTVNVWISQITKVTKLIESTPFPDSSITNHADMEEISFWVNMESALQSIHSIEMKKVEVKTTIMVLKNAKRFLATIALENNTNLDSALAYVQDVVLFLKPLPIDKIVTAQNFSSLSNAVDSIFTHLPKIRFSKNYDLERLAQLVGAISLTFTHKLSDLYKEKAGSLSVNYESFVSVHEEANGVIKKWNDGWNKFVDVFTDLCRRRKLSRTPQALIGTINVEEYKSVSERILDVYNFRQNHELLRQHVMHSHPKLVSEVESAITAFNGISVVDIKSNSWQTACESYDARIHAIETKLASVLSAKLSGCRDAEEMFGVFKQFTQLLNREPIRQSVKQYQTALMENTTAALNTLQQKFTDHTTGSKASKDAVGIPPVTARLLWAKLMEREVNRLQENLAALLGPDWARDLHGAKLATRCQELLSKLDARGYLRQWVLNQEKFLTGSLVRRSYVLDVKKDSSGYYPIVNFSNEMANLSDEVDMLTKLGYHRDIPRTLGNFAQETKQQYPYAIAIRTALRTYSTIVRQLDTASARLVEPQLNTIAEQIKLAFGNKRIKWESKGLGEWVSQLINLVEQLEGRVYNLLVLRCKLDDHFDALAEADGDTDLAEHTSAVQKIIDDLSLAGYSNLAEYCDNLDKQMEKVLVEKLEELLESFENESIKGKLSGSMNLNIVIRDGRITIDPDLSKIREQYISLLHQYLSSVTGLHRIQSSRFELFNETKTSEPKTFHGILRLVQPSKLVKCYRYIDKCVKDTDNFSKQWLSYQVLWETNVDEVKLKLGDDLKEWLRMLADYRDARKILDGDTDNVRFGAIDVSYFNIKSQISLKYDSWWHELLTMFTHTLGSGVLSLLSTLKDAKGTLENIHLHPATNTTDLLRGVTLLRRTSTDIVQWDELCSHMKDGEKFVRKFNRKLPNDWQETSLLTTTLALLGQALKKRQTYLRENSSALQGRVKLAGGKLEQKVDEVLDKWSNEKPLSGKILPSDALLTLRKHKKGLCDVKDEIADLDQALLALEVPTTSSKGPLIEAALDDLKNLNEVWAYINVPYLALSSLLSSPFVSCNLRKLRGELDRLLQECRSLPSRVRQYDGYNSLRDSITNSISSYSLLTELQTPAIQPRHWNDILKLLNIATFNHEKVTTGDLLNNGLMVRKVDIHGIVARAQGEMALELFLNEIKGVWSKPFHLILYQNRIRLIKDWDELYTTIDDHLTQLALMPGSPYFTTSPAIPPLATSWTSNLTLLRAVFDTLIDVQRRWVYLESIFGSGSGSDVRGSLPAEWSRFQGVDKEFVQLMRKLSSKNSIIEILSVESLVKSLERMGSTCSTIQKHLNQYLQMQRQQFCRFYFTGDDDLLDIIGGGSGMGKVASHLAKMFAGIVGIDGKDLVGPDASIESLLSREGEVVHLSTPISLNENVITWLTKLEKGMQSTIADLLHAALSSDSSGIDNMVSWAEKYPAQVVILSMLVQWSMSVDSALAIDVSGESKSNPIDELKAVLLTLESKLAVMAETVLSSNVAPNMRKKYEQVITELVHQRDVTRTLIENGVSNNMDFSWLYHLRFHYDGTIASSDGENLSDALSIHLSHAQFPYGYEYQGISERLVQTPLTDRCYLTLTQALHFRLGGSPFGPAGTGKTESVKALGATMGKFVVVMNCDESFDFGAMGRLFCGLCQVGAWGCFDEFNRLEERILSAVSSQILTIQQGLLQRQSSIELLGKQISLHPGVGVFVTMNPGYAGRSNLPDNLKTLFRSVAMVVPDRKLIAQVMLFSQGIISAEGLSGKVVDLFLLCEERMSKQKHYDFGLRALKTLLVSAGNLKRSALDSSAFDESNNDTNLLVTVEKNVLIQGACQNVVPKLVASDLPIFTEILSEVFPGAIVSEMEDENVKKVLFHVCEDLHYVPGDKWIQKILQLKQVLESRHGVMLAGSVGTGKSSALKCLKIALEKLNGIKGDIHIIDAKAMDKDALYGTLDGTTMEWEDGVFTSILRVVVEGARGEKDRFHWIVFDGDVDPEWAENLNSVLDDNKLLTLPSGERINIPSNIRIIIEVDGLEQATPATVSRCGMVWFSEDTLTTSMCLENLMNKLLSIDATGAQQVSDAQLLYANCLKPLVCSQDKGGPSLVEESLLFALKQPHIMRQSREQLLTPFYSLLQKGLEYVLEYNESHPDFPMDGEHLDKFSQRWLLFSVLWSFTGSAAWSIRRNLGDLLCNLSGLDLPEEGSNLVDYRVRVVDGELENWSQIVPRSEIESHQVTATDVVVTTSDTVRHTEILSAWLNSRKPLVLCGPPGSGKTLSLTSVLQSMQNITLASLNFSSGTTPEIILKTFSQYCSYYRRGKNIVLEPMEAFGADNWLVIFCDEINLPKKDNYGTQRVIMFMRQLVEQGGFWRDDNVWIKINRIQFVGACNPPTDAGREEMSPRFLRHAPLLLVDFPSQESLRQIYGTFNGGILKLFPNLKGETNALTEAMVELYSANQAQFSTEVQPQYFYSPRELSRWVRGIYEAVHAMEALSREELVRIWAHEALRLFCDRLVTIDEKNWCEDKIDVIARKWFADVDFEEALERPLFYSTWLTKDTRRIKGDELKSFLAARLRVFYEEELDVPLVIFDDVLEHVLRIDRVLRQPMGHCLLVGDSGVGKTVLSKFVSWMNGLSIFQIKAHSRYNLQDFNEDLRSVMKRVGVEGEKICFIFDEANALDSGFLEAMNALLASGEVPGLFDGDDYSSLMTACRDSASREGLIIDQEEELWRRFTSLVQRNLHVIFTMNPSGGDWKNRSTASPALFNRCVVDWFGTWDGKAKGQVGKEFTLRLDIGDAESIGGAFGIGPGEKLMETVRHAFDDTVTGSFRQAVVAALVDIHEVTKTVAEETGTDDRRTFLSPRDYLTFIQNFVTCVNERRTAVEDEQLHINAGLSKLRQTQENVEDLKLGLGRKTVELREKEALANKKLQQMVADQNIAEKRKEVAEKMGKDVEKQQKEISRRKIEAQRDLDEAEPALIEAQTSVKSIKKRDLDEVRNLARPPKNVQLTLECVALMLGAKTDWIEIRKMLSKSDFISNVINFDANRLSERQINEVQEKYIVGNEELNVESVMRSSKACGPLYKWAESQIKFSAVYNRVQPLRDEVEQLEKESETAKSEKERIDNEVNDLELKISQYKTDYATLIRDVEILKDEMSTVTTKVTRAESLLKSLGHESERWEKSSASFTNILQSMIGDGLLLAAFLTYTGYFDFKTRSLLASKWKDTLDSIGIIYRSELSMVESLSKASERLQWESLGLPGDLLSMENGVILDHCIRFPLIIDPSGKAIDFVTNKSKNEKIQKTSFLDKAFMKTLASAVRFGTTLLVENVESIDPVLNPILNKEIQRTGGRSLVRIGTEEVDYSQSFKLILTTKNPAARLSPDICSRVTLINFTVTPASLESQSLSLILQKEKPEVERQRVDLLRLQGEQNVMLRNLEDQMLEKISSVEGSILDDDNVVEGMERLMKEGAVIEEQIARSASIMAEVEEAISNLSSLAGACRSIFVLLASLRKIHFLYEFSSESFMIILEQVLDQSKTTTGDTDESRLKLLRSNLVNETIARIGRGLLSEDKAVFVLYLSKIVFEEELKFDDDANLSDVVKKIGDIYGQDFEWRGRGLDSLKIVAENEINASVPLLLCNAPGHDVSGRVESMAKNTNRDLSSVAMGSIEGIETAEKLINVGAKLGKWVLLKNCHLCTEWLGELVKKVQSLNPHNDFRLFITSEISPKLPTGLVRMSDKTTTEAQTGVKATLSRFFMNISTDRLPQSESNRLYLLIGWVHAIIQERLRFLPTGWTEHYEFTESDALHALDSIDALVQDVSEGKLPIAPEKIPWEAIRATLSKSIFGGRISNPVDQGILDSFLNKLFVPECFDVGFQLVTNSEGPCLPEDTSREKCLAWIESLPSYNPPAWIGLDAVAEEMKSKATARNIIEKLKLLSNTEVDE